MLSVIVLSVVKMCVIRLSVIKQNVIMLSVVMQNVEVPHLQGLITANFAVI